jgi:hypothetical protein
MTAVELLALTANNGGLQLYLPVKFVSDSTARTLRRNASETRYLVHTLRGGGILVLPAERALDYPITIREPPPETYDVLVDDADFSTLPFSRTDLRDAARRDPDPPTAADGGSADDPADD